MIFKRSGYLIKEGIRSIFTHGFMSFASVTIIMACLIIMGSVSLLSMNIDNIIGELEEQNEIVVFVDESLTLEQAQNLLPQVESIENIAYVSFVSRQDAMGQFMSNYDQSLMEGIDETVFIHRYIVNLADISRMSETRQQLNAIDGIAKVNAHIEYAKTFITIRNIVTVVSLVLIAVLAFVSVFIMTNTIKLATYGRKEEIAIMKMVGATNSFIRLPFEVEGLTLGLVGGLLAFASLYGLYNSLTNKLLTNIGTSFFSVIPFSRVGTSMFLVFVISGAMVGVFGSSNAIRNYLKV